MATGTKLARGRITIVNMNDGADAVVIYTRSQLQPATPTGANPSGWSATPSTYDNNYWTLWASSAKKNADGTISGTWSAPIPAEVYDSNALGRFSFVVGSGNQLPYIPYSSTDNIREAGLNPFGVQDILWRGKSQISSSWCGGPCLDASRYVPLNNAKRYRFSCWMKRNTWAEGNLYFGVQGTVQTGATWTDNSNHYFWSTGPTSVLEADKWYLVVGYLYESDSNDAVVDIRSGVYNAQTGVKMLSSSSAYYARQKAGTTLYGFRIAQYNCTTVNPEARFWQPRIDLCDGREPSIEELLKKNPLQPTIAISGENVFKFAPGQSVPAKTALTLSATLINGLTSYQWQYSNGGAWTSISGATAATYSLAYNYSAWGSNSSLRLRCISTLAGEIYNSNEVTITKIYDGANGTPGIDANLLDWVADWNTAKTVIDSNSVITPKIFAGVKNANNTVTGVALGRFSMSARNDAGTIVTETIDGIYGFRDGYKTFFIDSGGNAQLGRGNQSIKYDAVTGKILFGSEVALAWVGATYIDASGIFTGTLSANTVNAIRINASQITAGTIDTSRIDTASLKATLITAGNIDALTLNVTKGKIGGWSIDADSIYLGTKNNASSAFTAASGAMTIGSSGIRGFKWRLDSTGAGAVAGGNISWDAAGAVTFAASVSLNWTTPIGNINTALGGTSFPKLTNISATGIYTGSITAEQITAGTISADRIAAGSISSTKLDAASIKANIINVGYINGLSCTFAQGTIGGWTINSGSLSSSQIVLDNTNKRIGVYGASSSMTSGQRTMLYYNTNSDFGLYSSDSAGNVIARLGSVNQIAGWNINSSQIYKNSVYLGADGSISNSGKWALNNDGSGSLASGNIAWNTAGTITFSAAVALNWTSPINDINNSLGGTSFPKLTYISSTGIYTGTLTASQVNAVAINAGSITTGTLSADRIAAGSIAATKLDAASIKSDIINTTYINGLSCTFVRGSIGGFTIGSDNMSVGTIGGVGQTPIQIRSTSTGSGYWYQGAYKPFGVSLNWYQSSNAGHLVFGQIAASGSTVKTGFIGIQMMAWDNTEYFCLSANSLLSGSKEVYNRIAGWAFDNAKIWKNNVNLGADGSIVNGTAWKLNNDGSGQVANGNISWNAAGTVTFASSVSLNWTNAIQTVQNNLTAATDNAKTTTIDLTGLNQSTYYPVVLGLSVDKRATILLYNTLGSSGIPSWSTHVNGFSCECEWVSIGNGWGTRQSIRSVLRSTYSWSSVSPFGDISQMTESSQEVIYLRGGGKYYFKTTNVGDISYKTSTYTMNTQTVSPKSSVTQPTPDVDGINSTINNSLLPKVTQITSTGVYTGSIVASQITAGTIDATRINTDSIRAAIVTAANINALTLTTDKGSIGGWSINSYQISKNSVILGSDGSITNSTRWRLNNDGSGQLANGNITWDTAGNVTAKGAVFNNVRVQGSVRNPFVLNDSSIWIGGDSSNQQNFNNYDNIVAIRGSWDEYISLPWTLANSGRRVTLVNYKWGSNETAGYMTIYAPSGKYFYEDGLAKSTITFSREVIELLGYGDSSTFFGWIVLNRRDIMTSKQYGLFAQVMYQGYVSNGGMIKQKGYDGNRCTSSRLSTGNYRIYMPRTFASSDDYTVMMTGITTNGYNTFAVLKAKSTSYFDVWTADDASANDGGFIFWVISMGDWT